jgi:hypothetical protein
MMLFTGLALIAFGLCVVAFEGYRFKVLGVRFDFFFYFSLWYFASYVAAPAGIALGGIGYANPAFPDKYSLTESPVAVLAIVAGYCLCALGYHSRLARRITQRLKASWRVGPRTSRLAWIAMLAIGVLSFVIFVAQYGGLLFVISNIAAIRSGGSGGGIERNTIGATINLFSKLIYFAAWMLFGRVAYERKVGRTIPKGTYLALGATSVMAILYSVASGGRGGMVITFVVFYLTLCFIYNKLFLRYVLILAPLAAFIVLFGKTVIVPAFFSGWSAVVDQMQRVMQQSSGDSLLANLMQNFTHPFLSLRLAIDAVGRDVSPNWFTDIPLGIYFYARLLGLHTPDTVTYVNTYLTLGVYDSNIPPGLVGACWYSAMFPGVVIGMLLYGYIGRIANDLLLRMARAKPALAAVYIIAGFRYGGFNFTGDLRVFVLQNAAFIVLSLVLATVFCRWVIQPSAPEGIHAGMLAQNALQRS